MLDNSKSFTNLYTMNIKFLIKDKEPFGPTSIKDVTKEFNYFTNIHPKWEVSFIIHSEYFQTLFENQHNCYIALSIKKIKYGTGNTRIVIGEELLFDQIFIPFFYPESFSPNFSEDVKPGENTTSTSVETSMTREMRVALYSYQGLISNKDVINAVLTNGDEGLDVGSAVKYIKMKSGFKEQEVIIDKISNETKYEYIVIPPHNFLTAMKDLQARYGIYDSALQVFYDEPILYILNKYSDQMHDYKKDTVHTVVMEVFKSNTNSIAPVPIEELENKDQKYLLSNLPQKINADVYNTELYGDVLTYVNYASSINTLKYKTTEVPETSEFQEYKPSTKHLQRDVVKHTKTGSKALMEYDELNNDYNISSYAKESTPHITLLYTTIDYIDYTSFKPNTEITLKFMDDNDKDLELGGKHHIHSGKITFTKVTPQEDKFVSKIENLVTIKV